MKSKKDTIEKKSSKKKKDEGIDISGIFGSAKSPEEVGRYFGTLLESIDSKMNMVLEESQSTRISLERKIDENRIWSEGKFNLVEAAITEHSKQIRELRTELTGKVDKTNSDLKDLRTELTGKVDKTNNDLNDLRTELTGSIDKTNSDLKDLRTELKTEIQGVRTELKTEIRDVKTELIDRMDNGFGSLKTELKAEIREVGNKVDRLESRLDITEPKVEVLLKKKNACSM